MISVAVIGCGYWGPNLLRNFVSCPKTRLVAACDRDSARLQKALALYPGVDAVTDPREVIDRSDVDAVAIATPVGTHEPLASAALEAGKHVLVEKPLALTTKGAQRLVRMATERGLTLMVDHTFVYSRPIQTIKRLLEEGQLGDLYFIDSVRINLGLLQNDVNVVWDLATHDLSIMDYLLERSPRSLSATGSCHISPDVEDVAYLSLDFGENLLASVHVNWLSPVKVRHLIIGGSRKSLVYNDLDPIEPIKVYDRGVDIGPTPEERAGVLISYRTGDIWSPHVPIFEPLQQVVTHFADCIATGSRPRTDGDAGLRVVRILDAAQRSIKAQGGRIML
jgi:predicted dehydrogenase